MRLKGSSRFLVSNKGVWSGWTIGLDWGDLVQPNPFVGTWSTP